MVNIAQFAVVNSIVIDPNNTNAIDLNSPLSLIDWLKSINVQYYQQDIYNYYNEYLLQWFNVKNVTKQQQAQTITNLYISLFKDISLNFSTSDEQRYIGNLDYTNYRQLISVIPFFTKKIKEICQYYQTLRENAKSSTVRQNLRGTRQGVEKNLLNNFYSNITTISQILSSRDIDLDDLKENIVINVQDLYDLNTSYYDVSSNIYDNQLFLNFEQAIRNQIKKYPVYISQLGTNNFTITLDDSGFNLSLLKDSDFIDQFNDGNETNLNLNNFIDLVKNNIGTDFYYLSVDSTGVNYVSGLLFTANSKVENYLNKHFPTTITIPLTSDIYNEYQIGSYFVPNKQAIINFYSYGITHILSALKPNTIYTFPTPEKYGNIRGLTQLDFSTPFVFFDNVEFLKESKTNTFQWGNIPTNANLKRFYAYTSKSELTIDSNTGIERYTDSEEFFKGDLKNIWANNDIYTPTNVFPIVERFDNLHISDNTLVDQKTDIFGNTFALFKKIKVDPNPYDFYNSNRNTCLFINGGDYNSNTYDLTTYTNSFSTIKPNAYLISYEFFPPTFCDRNIVYNIAKYSGGSFLNQVDTIFWNSGEFNFSFAATQISGGIFLVNGTDLDSVATYISNFDSLSVNNNTQTKVLNVVDSLSANIGLFDERNNTFGTLYVRLLNSTIKSLADVFSSVYSILTDDVVNDINNNLKSFEIIEDVFVFSTSAYCVFCPVTFDYNINQYIYNGVAQVLSASSTSIISNVWYSQSNKTIFVSRINTLPYLSGSNQQVLYPDIYTFNNKKLKKIYPPNTNYNTLSIFSLKNTEYLLYFYKVEPPVLSYNSYLDQYCISFLVKDPSDMSYVINDYFKYNLDVYNVESILYKPHNFNHSENFTMNMSSSIVSFSTYNNVNSLITLSAGYLSLV